MLLDTPRASRCCSSLSSLNYEETREWSSLRGGCRKCDRRLGAIWSTCRGRCKRAEATDAERCAVWILSTRHRKYSEIKGKAKKLGVGILVGLPGSAGKCSNLTGRSFVELRFLSYCFMKLHSTLWKSRMLRRWNYRPSPSTRWSSEAHKSW